MATRASNSNNSIVRKKVTPSSNSRITPKPTNIIRPATIASSASKFKTTTSTTTPTSSGKSVPNYLKPTSSSRPESSNLAKKNINEDDTQQLLRRRSFDKAPSTTKSLVSPNPKERVVSRDRRLPNRSASFSPSSSSSSRIPTLTTESPVLDRNSKSLKPAKPQPGTIRRSSSFTRTTSVSKNSNNVSHFSKGSNDPHDAIQDMDMEVKQESDKEFSSVQEAEETVLNVEREEEVQSDMQKDENKEDVDGEGEEVKPSEISVVAEEPKILEEDSNGNELHEDIGEEEENHSNDQSEEGIKADEAEAELINNLDKGGENTNWDEKFKAASPEEAVEDEKKKEESEEVKCKEGEDVVVVEENGEEEEEEANVVQQKRQVVQAKKESPAAYNDVIEETKNKLLEKRKNKVKALVGAFETVIDYETAGSNK